MSNKMAPKELDCAVMDPNTLRRCSMHLPLHIPHVWNIRCKDCSSLSTPGLTNVHVGKGRCKRRMRSFACVQRQNMCEHGQCMHRIAQIQVQGRNAPMESIADAQSTAGKPQIWASVGRVSRQNNHIGTSELLNNHPWQDCVPHHTQRRENAHDLTS